MRNASVVMIAALALAALPSGLRAQAGTDTVVEARDDTRAQRIFSSLMSPYCPGLTVASCPSPGAEQMRQEVRRRLAAGEGERTIVAAFVGKYGEGVLGAPPARRWGLVLWIAPAVMLLLGGGALARWLRRRVSLVTGGRAQSTEAAALTLDPVLNERLAEELRAFEREV